MKNKIILFDLDGTLIDSTKSIVDTFYHTFEKFGLYFEKDDERIKKEIGYPLEDMYESFGVKKEDISSYVDAYKSKYRKVSVGQTTLLSNAYEALELASKYAKLAVVTTKTRRYTTPLLENMKVSKYFETIIGREDVQNPKPHQEPILKAINDMNLNINENDIYMIGDTKLDLISANSANVIGIGVLCGHGEEKELKLHTSFVFKNALEAVKFISIQKNDPRNQ